MQTPPAPKPACGVFAFADVEAGPAPLKVLLTAEGDCTEGEVSFLWDFGDGSPPVSETTAVHTYEKPGNYKARVHIESTTNPKLEDTDDVDIVVTPPQG